VGTDLDVGGDLTLSNTAAVQISHSGSGSLSISSGGYVAVESVQFAGDNIGISGDTNLMVLTSGVLTVDGKVASTTLETSGAATVGTTLDVGTDLDVGGDLTLSNTAAVQISHSGSGSLSISSGGYVAVESVQFAGDNIGISGDTNLMALTSGVLTVDGKVASTTLETSGAATVGTSLDVGGDLTLSNTAAVQISHSGSGSLSISSGGYVAVESVQFAGTNIGISGDTNLMVLTSGVLTVDGKVASTTLETSGAATVGTSLDVGGDLTLSNTAAVQISHSGSGSLSISSGGYVAVESVQFAGDNIGISGDTNLMVLTSGVLTVDGKVASTTLETSGAATVGTTLDVGTDLDVGGDLTLSNTAAVQISHSGTWVSVDIERRVRGGGVGAVCGDNIGISGDTNLMVLTSGVLTVDGKVASTTLETSGAATVGRR
jgi:ribosomal protein L27